ncbi:50S ribosomal protein L5 [Candidatus Woesearchaeota archaeon]|nr:50S ribosomal protein L5 [uncultured archaeon]MBS3139401.1 50S ribosomal protein L5 [Candidatus Woesearchaeota archaeon]
MAEPAISKLQNNPLREIKIAKITLNVGAGKDEEMLKKGLKLLQKLSNEVKPIATVTKKRIPGWNLRPGLKIGCKATIRKNTVELLKRLLAAKKNTLSEDNFDNQGNFSFGVPEYIDIQGLDYDPELKIMGLEVAVTLQRAGFRIKERRIKCSKVGKNHLITKGEAINFARNKLQAEVR